MEKADIPEQVRDVMEEQEIENMLSFTGWATGTVVELDENGDVETVFEDAWIELFNGKGLARDFGGIKFFAVKDGEYTEAYGYPDEEYVNDPPCYFVREFDQEDVDYGTPVPNYP